MKNELLRKMKLNFLPTLLIPLLSGFMGSCECPKPAVGNGKKVYADYHGVRYTRQHDGQLGRWSMFASTTKSKAGRPYLCYNADNILADGTRDIASAAYPLVGMQSDLDPDYIEYQILTAKAAKIDGFFIEWGFMGHENDIMLKAMQPIAEKYDFEIGVNWCDGWLYYNWITLRYPEINTREKKTEHFGRCYQYLLDSVLTGPTAPIVNGHPVFYLFGPGISAEEFSEICSGLPDLQKVNPVVLRRWADWGSLKENQYQAVRSNPDMDKWKKMGAVPTPWLPARVRSGEELQPKFDYYATSEDVLAFLEPFKDSIWSDPEYPVRSGFVMPGMDNSGCAGWGRQHYFYISREEGATYRKMWDYHLANKEKLDMMFIASWSDFTEGHEVVPTHENGYRDLTDTHLAVSRFKEEKADTSGLSLPLRLFNERKNICLLKSCKIESTGMLSATLDSVARQIAAGNFIESRSLLAGVEQETKDLLSKLKWQSVSVEIKDPYRMRLEPELCERLMENHYRGYIEFEYMDQETGRFQIVSNTLKSPESLFKTVAEFHTAGTGEWKKAKVELYKENVSLDPRLNHNELNFSKNARVKDIRLHFEIFQSL